MRTLVFLLVTVWAEVNTGQVETIIEFSRRMDSCDDKDVVINDDGTTNIVYALGASDSLQQHTVRGSRSLRLLQDQAPFNPIETDIQTVDLRHTDYAVPFSDPHTGNTTTYYTIALKNPIPFGEKVHMIRWQALIDPPTNEGTVHHMMMYDCGTLNETLIGKGFHSNGPDIPKEMHDCLGSRMVAGWAVGGTDSIFPPHVGFPMGEEDGVSMARYLVLEIHYDNPQARTDIRDASGFRLTYTKQYRQNEAATFITAGTNTNGIPPQTARYEFDYWCPGVCTERLFPGPVNLIGVLLHAHTAARGITLQHARDGVELPPISADPHYDFNLQDFVFFNEEITFLPGDALYQQCAYNTLGRPKATPFGLSTQEEMCLSYIVYYPRAPAPTQVCGHLNDPGSEWVMCGTDILPRENGTRVPIEFPRQVPACVREGLPANESTTPTLRSVDDFAPEEYTRHEYLDQSKNVLFHWKPDRNNSIIHFAVQANTQGWVGLGISPNKGMVGSDIALGGVNEGEPFFEDRYAEAKALPPADVLQDLFAVTVARGIRSTPKPADEAWKVYIPIIAALVVIVVCAGIFMVFRRSKKNAAIVVPEKQPEKYGALATKDDPHATA